MSNTRPLNRNDSVLLRTGSIIFDALRKAEGVDQVSVTYGATLEARVIINGVPLRIVITP